MKYGMVAPLGQTKYMEKKLHGNYAKPGKNPLLNGSCTATYLPSHKPSK